MKYLIWIPALLIQICLAQNVGIGTTTPHASAKFDITSTSSGLLPPRMTTAQRNAIVLPAAGLTIFNTTTQSLEFYSFYGWRRVTGDISGTNKLIGRAGFNFGNSNYPTTDGGSVITGSSAPGQFLPNDCIVIRLTPAGDTSWIKYYGGAASDDAQSIMQTSDGGYIMGANSSSSVSGDVTGINHGTSDFWIVKLDAAGNILWNKLLGGDGSEALGGIRQTSDGGYIVAGYTTSSANGDVSPVNHGQQDVWIIKLDAAGNISWQKLLGGTLADYANTIKQTSDGGYIIAGYSLSSASGDVTGTLHSATFSDAWIVKLDAAGNITWNKLLGGTGTETAKGILQTVDGGYLFTASSTSTVNGDVTATNHGGTDIWLVKLDPSGNITSNKLLGSTGDESINDLQPTADGSYVIASTTNSGNNGNVVGTARGNLDYWILKTDALGNIAWSRVYGGSGSDVPNAIFQATDGSYHIAGRTNSSYSFDIKVDGYQTTNIWILRLDVLGYLL
jgi:hypothetical protein